MNFTLIKICESKNAKKKVKNAYKCKEKINYKFAIKSTKKRNLIGNKIKFLINFALINKNWQNQKMQKKIKIDK